MPQNWQTHGRHGWLCEDWEEETFLFNPLSGHTHILNGAAVALLEILVRAPADIDSLTNKLLDHETGLDSEQFKALLARQLEQLFQMGLIKPVP